MAAKQDEKNECLKIEINGIVQGVGFRPFIYRLAKQNNLNGYVLNDSSGVEIEVEGHIERIDAFLEEIQKNPPPLAVISSLRTDKTTSKEYSDFIIRESREGEDVFTLISPDISICQDCLKELFDPSDRRYLYPFINCTNCGPRYTIIDNIPYDRKYTSMKHFTMCVECQKEYDDPLDRRFHAQPNACAKCGPMVELLDNSGKKLNVDNPVEATIEFLRKGKIVAIKGLGGFHLACDAQIDDAVQILRARKYREEKPLALMVEHKNSAKNFAYISSDEETLLGSIQRPVVLLKKRFPNTISSHVAPDNNYFGVMLSYTPIHYILLKNNFTALVMTSGNLSEEPIATGNDEAVTRLKEIADYFLIHNRDIYLRNDDSVYRIFNKKPYPVRRSRGYVPVPVFLHKEIPSVLGCGAELKNTVCFTKGNRAFLSQHIGDMENYVTLKSFEETIIHLQNILEIEPEIIAYDLHPEYLSTKYALELNDKELAGVQHHHAHIVSCMAENHLNDEVIGISIDGTGYGADGNIWGGEFLVSTLTDFERIAHFDYTPMPGGEKAIKEPWRMAVSYLYKAYGEAFMEFEFDFLKKIDENEKDIIVGLIEKGINSPLTSSCGRLFDGVAALIGIKNKVKYEGQAAIELENKIPTGWKYSDEKYNFSLFDQDEVKKIRTEEIIKQIVLDVSKNVKEEIISYKFHNTLIDVFREICLFIKGRRKIKKVVLSGGCFQNIYLLSNVKAELERNNFSVHVHTSVPPNDGGISLGQAVIAGLRAGGN